MVQFHALSLWKAVVFLSLLTVGHGKTDPECRSLRCLSQMLIDKELFSPPQNENCSNIVDVHFIEYQTLSVDTKNLRLHCRLEAYVIWRDPEMAWNESVYPYRWVSVPADKIWTPGFRVTNAIVTTVEHGTQDVMIYSEGVVLHVMLIDTEVICDVNLFNYPFAADECPVALHSWSACTKLKLHHVYLLDGDNGDWTTDSVRLYDDYGSYILVSLSIKYLNPFITLLLPSILLVLADAASFALPLGSGERNTFKVTLVLSFTMFLIILNEKLPGDSQCSPIIRTHFCVCLILLVLSMLVSLVLTRVAKEGSLIFCCCKKWSLLKNTGNKKENKDKEEKVGISVIQLSAMEELNQMLRTVVNFLEDHDAKEMESEKHQAYANKVDKIFFWIYFISATAYFISMICVMVKYKCSVNHFEYWYDYERAM